MTGEVLDLAGGHDVQPEDAGTWPAGRTVPAAALRAALNDPDLRVDPRGLQIRAARFDDRLCLEDVHFPHRLRLTSCSLAAGIDADFARFRHLALDHSHVHGGFNAVGATIDGQFNLIGATLTNTGAVALEIDQATINGGFFAMLLTVDGEVRAVGATVNGQLNLTQARLNNTGGNSLSIDGVTIRGSLAASSLRTHGTVSAVGATMSDLNLNGAELANPGGVALLLDRAQVSGNAFATALRAHGEFRFLEGKVGAQLVLDEARLINRDGAALGLDGVKVGGGMYASGLRTYGGLRAPGSTIGGQLILRGARFINPKSVAVGLDGVTVRAVFAQGLRAYGEVRAAGATVHGELNLTQATLNNPGEDALLLDGVTIGGSLFAYDLRSRGRIRARAATIAGSLELSGAALRSDGEISLSLDGSRIEKQLFLNDFYAIGEVRAIGAAIDGINLTDAKLSNPGNVALNLESANVSTVVLRPASTEGALHFPLSRIEHLFTSDTPPEPLFAQGWQIGALHGGIRDDWRRADRWVASARRLSVDGQSIAVQPWGALADAYDRAGDPAGAKRLRLAAARQLTRQSRPGTRGLRRVNYILTRNGYYPLWTVVWLIGLLGLAAAIIGSHRPYILATDQTAARVAIERHVATDATTAGLEPAGKQHQAAQFVPVTAATPCAVLQPDYPCMRSWVFAINAVLPPAAATNRSWDVAADAPLWLSASLPLIKLAAWALTALLLAGVTGILRKD